MSWDDCHNFFDLLRLKSDKWYLYDIDNITPTTQLTSADFIIQIDNIQDIIKSNHTERYCGIVYTNDLKYPAMIKIFHPNNLGKSCGSSENPPLARWYISKLKPTKITQIETPKQSFVSKFFS